MKKINRRTKVLILTVIMAVVFVAIYLFGIFIPEEAVAGCFLNAKMAPSWEHPFGTDALGRDLLMRTLKGLSVSITVGIAASVISAVIAVFVGIAAATGSKRLDAFINWCIDLAVCFFCRVVWRFGYGRKCVQLSGAWKCGFSSRS